MSIEQRIYDKLVTDRINEAVKYMDNSQISSDLAKGIGDVSFDYPAAITTPSNPKGFIGCKVKVDINEDDVEAVESNNVVYVYLNVDHLDYQIIDAPTDTSIAENIHQVVDNITGFTKGNPKCWRDDSKLYLLKMNRNSGIIGRFDPELNRFVNQEVNYNPSNDTEIARDLLTRDYLEHYFTMELNKLFSPIDPISDGDINAKFSNEQVTRLESAR